MSNNSKIQYNFSAIHCLNRARARNELQMQQAIIIKNADNYSKNASNNTSNNSVNNSVNNDAKNILSVVFPAEYAQYLTADKWRIISESQPKLLLSAKRAQALGWQNKIVQNNNENGKNNRNIGNSGNSVNSENDENNKNIAVAVSGYSPESLWQLIAGKFDKEQNSSLPAREVDFPESGGLLLALAKEAGILPALLWFNYTNDFSDSFAVDLNDLSLEPPLELLSGEAVKLPIAGAENTSIRWFRNHFDNGVHLALIIGDLSYSEDNGAPPLVRVHSSCVTGDILGSMRCDCGGQLKLALDKIKADKRGILLYLHQEGRNIGIVNKLRAYALQQEGMDTFSANNHLGFEDDERDYAIAAAMLKSMNCKHLRLLTNNSEKPKAFAASGIEIAEIVALKIAPNAHNKAYIEAKENRGDK